MKVQVFLPATVIMSVLMVALIKVRRDEKQELDKRATFLDIKLRVSEDVLQRYSTEKVELKKDVNTAKDQNNEADKDVKPIQEAADKARLEAEKCAEEQVRGARVGEGGVLLSSARREKLPLTQFYLKIGEVN